MLQLSCRRSRARCTRAWSATTSMACKACPSLSGYSDPLLPFAGVYACCVCVTFATSLCPLPPRPWLLVSSPASFRPRRNFASAHTPCLPCAPSPHAPFLRLPTCIFLLLPRVECLCHHLSSPDSFLCATVCPGSSPDADACTPSATPVSQRSRAFLFSSDSCPSKSAAVSPCLPRASYIPPPAPLSRWWAQCLWPRVRSSRSGVCSRRRRRQPPDGESTGSRDSLY